MFSQLASHRSGKVEVASPPELHLLRYEDFDRWREKSPRALASLCALLEMLGQESRERAVVERFAQRRELEFDLDLLAALDHGRLVNALAAALPFEPAEQQALLEATGVRQRGELLLALMRMEVGDDLGAPGFAPPTVN